MSNRVHHLALNKGNLADRVFEKLLQAIKSGAYSEDERLPPEHDLAAEFQVSRPIIRDALKRLRDQRYIYSRRGAGSFVRHTGVRQPLGFGRLANIDDLRRCYEFRLVLEPAAAEIAATNRSDADLQRIETALNIMHNATAQRRHREDADFAFHYEITAASGNKYMATALYALKEHIDVGMQFHGRSLKQTDDGLERVYKEHREIFDAICSGDGRLARQLMTVHLDGSKARLFSS